MPCTLLICFFFFNDTATTEIYTLSLHDALPISERCLAESSISAAKASPGECGKNVSSKRRKADSPAVCRDRTGDRKSTRLNSSHVRISYAVFCLKKKKETSSQSENLTPKYTCRG